MATDGTVTVTFSGNFVAALILYKAHKEVCTMPYDPYREPRQCPECARLIDEVAKEMLIDKES